MAPVNDGTGWRPLQKPQRAASVNLAPTPFTRFARLHALGTAADGLVAVALAGSIFFSIEPDAARWRVALYLLLTIAPFAVVTPLIGPVVDRTKGGRRGMILASAVARAVVAFLMVSNIETILLFPLAFSLLVLQKAYSVAKSAVVPKLVGSETKLVEANSKLALLSSISSMSGAAVGAVLSFVGGPPWAAALAVLVYLASALAGIHLPRIVVAETPIEEQERAELRSGAILLGASGMGLLRGVVGFMTFLLAFELRGGKDGVDVKPEGAAAGAATAMMRDIDIVGDPGAPAWHFGAVALAAGLGTLIGARVAPQLRQWFREERILLGAFALTALVGLEAAFVGELAGAMSLSLAVAVAAASGKLAFDSLVQRDAPDANYGRSFARFEARFQLTWVTGAFIPVVLRMPERIGYLFVTAAAGFAAVTYYLGTRDVPDGPSPLSAPTSGADDTTTVLEREADPTAVFDAPTATLSRDGDQADADDRADRHDPPPASPTPAHPSATPTWGDLPVQPLVTSVEGVEVELDVDGRGAGRESAREPGHDPARDVDSGVGRPRPPEDQPSGG